MIISFNHKVLFLREFHNLKTHRLYMAFNSIISHLNSTELVPEIISA